VGEIPEEGIGFLEEIPLPGVVLDPGGTIRDLNSRFSALLGQAPGDLRGAEGFSFLCPSERERVKSSFPKLGGEEDRLAMTVSLLKKDGSGIRSRCSWSLAPGRPGLPLRYIGLFIAMPAGDPDPSPTGIAGIRKDSQDRWDRLVHGIIFHDTKNRLAALHGYAQLLRESLPGSGFLIYIDKLEEIASEMERDLGVASILSHLGLTAPRWQNLREVAGRSASRDTRCGISMENLPGSFWCLADPLLPRVFSNLFENARRHGEKVTAIRIAAREGEEGLVISVEDDGIGIPADQKERIFEPGFGKHTGYGLYLAREILSIAGFSIRETGDFGRGARFEIHIPGGRYMIRSVPPEEPDPVRIPAA